MTDTSTNHLHVGVEEADRGYGRFVDAWHRAGSGDEKATEIHLNFEDLRMLVAVLTPKRLELLKVLRNGGPVTVRSLATSVARDYKNVHVDCAALETAGLIRRDEQGLLIAPWDVIDAHFRLVA